MSPLTASSPLRVLLVPLTALALGAGWWGFATSRAAATIPALESVRVLGVLRHSPQFLDLSLDTSNTPWSTVVRVISTGTLPIASALSPGHAGAPRTAVVVTTIKSSTPAAIIQLLSMHGQDHPAGPVQYGITREHGGYRVVESIAWGTTRCPYTGPGSSLLCRGLTRPRYREAIFRVRAGHVTLIAFLPETPG